LTFPVRNTTPGTKQEEETFSIAKYLSEFDIKDVLDISDGTTTKFKYDPQLENKLAFNMLNGFRRDTSDASEKQERKELLSKLETPDTELGSSVRRYTITPSGVLLRKGETLGWFEMGSTIALIFECPQDYEFKFKEGEKLRMGQEILAPIPQECPVEPVPA
jgi:Phosphatidylserine decarboxylase